MVTHHPRSSRSPQDDRPTPCPVAGSSPRQDVVRRQVDDILAQLGNPDVIRIAAVNPRRRRDEATRSLEQPPRTERTQPTGGAQPSSRPDEIPRRGNLRRTNSSPSLGGDPFLRQRELPAQGEQRNDSAGLAAETSLWERQRRFQRHRPLERRMDAAQRMVEAEAQRMERERNMATGWQDSERVQRVENEQREEMMRSFVVERSRRSRRVYPARRTLHTERVLGAVTGEAEATERAPRTEGVQLTQEVQQPRPAADFMRRFECPICLDTLEDPAGCGRCSGRFCLSCLNAARNRVVSCPTCRRRPVRGTFQKDTRLREEIERAQEVAQQVAEQVAQQMAEQGPDLFLERICQSLEVAAGTARDPMTTEPTVRFSSFRETNHCSTDVSVSALGDDETGRDLVKKAQETSAGRGDGVFAFSPEEVRKAKSGDAKLFFIIRHGRCFTQAEFFELTRAQMLILLGPQMVLPVIVCLQDVDKSLIPGVNMDEW